MAIKKASSPASPFRTESSDLIREQLNWYQLYFKFTIQQEQQVLSGQLIWVSKILPGIIS